jgi:hypothetical protein
MLVQTKLALVKRMIYFSVQASRNKTYKMKRTINIGYTSALLCSQLELTVSEESSDIEIALLLLLSSRPKIKERPVLEACLWDDGRE